MRNIFLTFIAFLSIFFFFFFSSQASTWFFSLFKPSYYLKTINLLKEENALLYSEISQKKEILKENKNLKKLLEIKEKEPKRKYFLAKVTGLNLFNYQPSIIIEVDKEIVKEGMPVILPGNILFGLVEKISGERAKVATLFSQEFSTSVKIFSSSEKEKPIIGLAKGEESKIIVDLVSKEKKIEKGDSVFTSGLDQKFPADLYLGKIRKIEKKEGLFQKIEIEPPFKWQEISQVFILLNETSALE